VSDAEPHGVEVQAVETFADLLFAFDGDNPSESFYSRLCEATCRLTDMDRAVIFLYDQPVRRVRAVGAHGIDLRELAGLQPTLESTPIALRALTEDRVVEASADDLAAELPDEYVRFLSDERIVCTPIAAAGRQPGVIVSDRRDSRPLTRAERHLLWTLGKIAALAASARVATREQERARELQERIDLAREIHDGVVQRLFGVSMALSVQEELTAEQRHRCASEIHDALADLRTAVQRPLGRPSADTRTTLLDEVHRLGDEHPELEVALDAPPDADVPEHLEPLAQSVLAEALRNALKHAVPSRVVVRVARDDGAFVLEIVNDGVRAATTRTGMGLRLAAFEALQRGGIIEFGEAGTGLWRVRLLVPAEAAAR
jgi:signal transduction histidine kinase